jgi:3-phenylpropionate/trans-cinnamate dioxygenase ferredoxin reductase subunit
MSHIVIIGNGIAGITAARHIRKKSDHQVTVISGETDFFFSRTALMYIYMGHMKYEHTKPYEDHFWKKNQISLIRDWIREVDFDKQTLTGTREVYTYDHLILALGSKPNRFGWPGQDLTGVQGLYSYQDLESMEAHTQGIKKAVVVGGGLIGIEMAEMLHSRQIEVTYLVREKHFWDIVLPNEESKLIEKHILEYGIDLRLETELAEILDDGSGNVKSIRTKSGEEIETQFVGLTVGVSPNIAWLKDTSLEVDKGILVDEYLQTNQPNVYAIGDCAQLKHPSPHRKPIEAVWYTGRMMGETIAQTITNSPTAYQPGIWFNSAKFFDIEYQTYGQVSPRPSSNEDQFYWQEPDSKRAVRISFDTKTKRILGVNTLGIRMRHEVWEQWILKGETISEVLTHLRRANFDPEFFISYEPIIQAAFNEQFPSLKVAVSTPSFFQKLLHL